jgi:hypothetical protein
VSSRTRPLLAGGVLDGVVEHPAVDEVGQSAFEAAHRFH